MQNVLVDDRRIWVDLYVPYSFLILSDMLNHRVCTAPNLLLVLMEDGLTTRNWGHAQTRGRNEVGMVAEETWKKLEDTERAVGAIVRGMTWCLMFLARSGAGAGLPKDKETGHKGDTGNADPVRGQGIMAGVVVVVDESERDRGAEVGIDMIDVGNRRYLPACHPSKSR